jgi:putative membrane protein
MLNEKQSKRLIYVVTAIVVLVVILLQILPKPDPTPWFTQYLPKLNAIINAMCTVLLVTSFIQIKRRNIDLHRKLNFTTFILSSVFLVSYILYHATGVETRFPENNPWRPVYLFILLTHIVLAAGVFPLILLSFYRGIAGMNEKHRKIARITMPIWIYVTATGVIVYLMISPYYPF